MAFLQNLQLKKPGQAAFASDLPSEGGASPIVGGGPSMPPALAAILPAGLSTPSGPGAAAPAAIGPQPAAGTRVGGALRQLGHTSANLQVGGLNAAAKVGAGAMNAFSLPARATEGFLRDTGRALVGAAPSPNSGQPLTGITAPQIKQPFPGLSPAAVPAPAPAAMPAAVPAAPSPVTTRPVPALDPNYNPAADNISASNLAAASKFTMPPKPAAAVDSGTTVGGRALPYGAMVGGVPTFSDGSGGSDGKPGSIPRTMSPDSIAALGSAPGGVQSQSFGGAPAITAPQITRPVNNGPNQSLLDMFAASDAKSIAQGDTRSALGSAARADRIEMADGGASGQAAAQNLAQLTAGVNSRSSEAMRNAGELAQQTQKANSDAALNAAQGDQAMALEGVRGKNTLANTALEQRTAMLKQPQQLQTLDDGSIGLVNQQSGATTLARLPDGSVAKGQPKNPPAPMYTTAGGAQTLTQLTNSLLGIDPLTGKIKDDKAPGGARLPTGDEQFAAMQKAQGYMQSLNGQVAPGGASRGPSPTAVAALKSNPEKRAEFDQRYGVGAASRVLGK